jgi:decaprenylphospho-beta-D-erythro-pentofuranosid-2-ulose 2-reductase
MPQQIAIFGATSAVAQALARRYQSRGARLALVGRNPDKLGAMVRELGSQVVLALRADLDRTEQAAQHVEAVFAALGRVDVLILAQGLLGDQEKSERDLAEAEQITRSNFLSAQAILVAAGPRLAVQKSGQVVVLSTVAAERGRPRNYTYAAAKAALNVYVQGMHSQLYRDGVGTTTIKLGPIDSPMTTRHAKNALFSTPESVAAQIDGAIARRVRVAYVPKRWRLIMCVVRHMPEPLFQRIGALSGR